MRIRHYLSKYFVVTKYCFTIIPFKDNGMTTCTGNSIGHVKRISCIHNIKNFLKEKVRRPFVCSLTRSEHPSVHLVRNDLSLVNDVLWHSRIFLGVDTVLCVSYTGLEPSLATLQPCSKYEQESYHVLHHRTYSKWDCIGGARHPHGPYPLWVCLEVRTPRHLLLLDATLSRLIHTVYEISQWLLPDFFKIIHQGIEHTLRLGKAVIVLPFALLYTPWIKQKFCILLCGQEMLDPAAFIQYTVELPRQG